MAKPQESVPRNFLSSHGNIVKTFKETSLSQTDETVDRVTLVPGVFILPRLHIQFSVRLPYLTEDFELMLIVVILTHWRATAAFRKVVIASDSLSIICG